MATSPEKGKPAVKSAGFIALIATVSLTAITAQSTNAAIITVNDSSSWIDGSNTLSDLGFDLIPVPNGSEALGTDLTQLSSPFGDIKLSPSVNKRQIGQPGQLGWLSWSNDYQGEVYFTNGATTLDLKLPNLAAFDFYAEPDVLDAFKISAIAKSGTVSEVLTQTVAGNAGAQYFGFYSDDPLDPIQSIRITSEAASQGFAIAQVRGATTRVPSPALLPGMLALGCGLWRKYRTNVNLQ